MHSLRKIPTRLRGTNFCTSSARFPPTFVRQPNCPNCTETHQNMSLGSNGWIGCVHCKKILTRLHGTNFCTSSARFAVSFVRQPNDSKCTQNMILGSDRVGRVRSLRNIPTRLHGTNFCTSFACFAPSSVRQPNGPKCTQIVRNTPKRQFSVL